MNYKCPNNCDVSDAYHPFFYPSVCTNIEEGVIADKEGEPTNIFLDGTRGVPQEVIDQIADHDYSCLHCILCGEEIEQIQ